jgi:hypothetical protein
VACRCLLIQNLEGGEAATAARIGTVLEFATVLVRLQHVFLAPLVLLAIPPAALLQQPALFVLVVALVGLAGTVSGRRYLATCGSLGLLILLVWGKASESILKTGGEDTAVLLIEFTMILFFMEASSTVLIFNKAFEGLREKDDEISQRQKGWLVSWLKGLLSRQGKVSLAAAALSIALLPLAGFTSISNSQLVVTATILFLAVMVLFFLLIYRREPGEE